MSQASSSAGACDPSVLATQILGSMTPIGRLTEYKNKKGDVSSVLALDDMTCMKPYAGNVEEARNKEIDYVRDMRVYTKIPRSQATRQGWKVIATRWIDISKGDDEHPNYRSRLVGKEFNNE